MRWYRYVSVCTEYSNRVLSDEWLLCVYQLPWYELLLYRLWLNEKELFGALLIFNTHAVEFTFAVGYRSLLRNALFQVRKTSVSLSSSFDCLVIVALARPAGQCVLCSIFTVESPSHSTGSSFSILPRLFVVSVELSVVNQWLGSTWSTDFET